MMGSRRALALVLWVLLGVGTVRVGALMVVGLKFVREIWVGRIGCFGFCHLEVVRMC